RNGGWNPLQDWPKSSILDQCMGAPFLLETDGNSWLNKAKKTLETSSWAGFLSSPLVTPVCPEVLPSPTDGEECFSHVKCDSKTWSITLDVSNFCPEEIGVKINDCYLEIAGEHKEKHNDHGTISKRFTRKYKLPVEVDLQKICSSLSPEGVLLVEIPVAVSSTRCPTETVVPTHMKEK
ncbi:heat shock protein beta-1-like, partial [Silurus meridionalis]